MREFEAATQFMRAASLVAGPSFVLRCARVRKPVLIPLAYVLGTFVLGVLFAGRFVGRRYWESELELPLAVATLLGCLIAGAVLLRRATLGRTHPALILLAGLIPVIGAIALSRSDFTLTADATPQQLIRWRLLDVSSLRFMGGGMSAASLSMLAFGLAFSASGLARRARGSVAGLLCAAPFLILPLMDGGEALSEGNISRLTVALPALVALVALPRALSSGSEALPRALTVALALGLAQFSGVMLLSSDLADCMFGFHGCTPASNLQIAMGCSELAFPQRWLESYPWIPGAGSVLLVALSSARHTFARGPLVAALALCAGIISVDALAMRRLSQRADGFAQVPARRSIAGFVPIARHERTESVSATLIVSLDAVHGPDGRVILSDAFAPSNQQALKDLFGRSAADSESSGVSTRSLALLPDARLSGERLATIVSAASASGIQRIYLGTVELEAEAPPGREVSTWGTRFSSTNGSVPIELRDPESLEPPAPGPVVIPGQPRRSVVLLLGEQATAAAITAEAVRLRNLGLEPVLSTSAPEP